MHLGTASEGVEQWRLERRSGSFRLTPDGSLWVIDDDASGEHLSLYRDGRLTAVSPFSFLPDAPQGSDGSLLIQGPGAGDSAQLNRLLPDGTVAWTLPISEPFESMTLDVDGRVYLYGGGHVIAVQTDMLPPGVRGCWQHRCSPHGDNRIEPLP